MFYYVSSFNLPQSGGISGTENAIFYVTIVGGRHIADTRETSLALGETQKGRQLLSFADDCVAYNVVNNVVTCALLLMCQQRSRERSLYVPAGTSWCRKGYCCP